MDLFVPVEDETIIFEKFKKVVSDLNQNDDVLIRFLRARDYDIPNAEKMLRNAVQWREATDINNYMKWKFPSNYEKDLPYRLFGKCNEGAAICWVFVGKWTTKKFVDNDEGEQVLRYEFAMMERGLRIIAESGRAGTIVLDMEGLTLAQATHIPSLKLSFNALQTVEQCYPEIAKAIYVINVPWVFSFAYNFVKSIIAPRTMEKIKIFSYKEEWQAEFLKRFPIDSIVPQLLPPSH
ncbi:SEC14-like protein 2 [Orchesella cincta]|uniref:SEC14-like protein 2 n=1 Tax=Orchesella cincta TaxID=48709 RepID=A0A1D2MNS6_ORCCI|nr:SEC14-like protein 2 [Orchesella cincta]